MLTGAEDNMTSTDKQISIKPIRICENCGHNHIAETGGKDGYTLTYELLSSCCYCNCEKYKGNSFKNRKVSQ